MNYLHLTQTLAGSFNALADEVQSLIDRKTILEHKLRYAHEQYQYLADKYAPAVPEISETLAKLQLPPDLHHSGLTDINFVPLPKRGPAAGGSLHQIALFIREGRKVAQQLASLAETSRGSGSSKETLSPVTDTMTSLSTILEQDFTVEGRKGQLGCPFSAKPNEMKEDDQSAPQGEVQHPTPHQTSDPICAAMLEDAMSTPAAAANGLTAKCPIRFLDQHSPEEIAHYVETHKHEIPRSHELCVRRYQKNEEQIRKLDAKYGNLVSMIKDLSQLHQPMLQSVGIEQPDEVDRASNERVENWAQAVTGGEADDPDHAEEGNAEGTAEDRESHFDRPLKEVRLGESPSRPWGISVPAYNASPFHDEQDERPVSPPPAPVRMPSPAHTPRLPPAGGASKCPFDHSKLGFIDGAPRSPLPKLEKNSAVMEESNSMERPFTPVKRGVPASPPTPPQPTFIQHAHPAKAESTQAPQMVFTGPVFIGYPIEQALQFMQHYQGGGR